MLRNGLRIGFALAVGFPLFVGAAPAGADIVINELDYDQPGTDTAEFVELANTGTTVIDLDPYTVDLVNGADGVAGVYRSINLPAVNLAPGGYYVICSLAANVDNCDLEVGVVPNLIQNGAPDAVALVLGGQIVDTLSYEGDTTAPYTEGSGSGLEDDPDEDLAGISRLPDGVDTDQNNADFLLRCITPGLPNLDLGPPCQVVPVTPSTWGTVKTYYR